MNSTQRVLSSCEFRRPDRVARFDSFWNYDEQWRRELGDEQGLSDIAIWVPDEGAFATRAGVLKRQGLWTYSVNSWGQTIRTRDDAYFHEVIASPLGGLADIEAVEFDPPDLDRRFLQRQATLADAAQLLAAAKLRQCVFGKTGGPFLRSAFVRGQTQFLMDIAGDPPFARALAEKMADHLIAVGIEEIRRWDLRQTGIWIFDDMAFNGGPMFSPRSFEQVFMPAYRRMVKSFKAAGAKYVFLHSDGNIRPLLDMLADAGIDGINPLEPRAGMDIAEVRASFPRLILVGGMDNCDTLINGPVEKIQAQARRIIDMARDGGTIIGAHSIGPDIPLKHFRAYHETCLTYGDFSG